MESPKLDKFRTNFYPRGNDPCDTTLWRTFNSIHEATAFNTYKVKLTPFKMSFFFNEETTSYFDLYRYYNTDGEPMDLDCGSLFPAGIYHINPRYPRPFQRWVRPLLNNKVHTFDDDSLNYEMPFVPENAIMTVDNVKVTRHYFNVCGSLQQQLPDECSITKALRIMPVGDNTNHLNIIDIATSPNIKDSIVLNPNNQLKGQLFYERLDSEAGNIVINLY